MRKLLFAGLSALSLVAVPTASFADDRHGGWRGGGYGGRGYYHGHGHNDALAAGVVGLAFGAILGAAISDSHDRRYREPAYDDYGPPPGYRYDSGPSDGYYSDGQCFRRELEWDPRSRQNVEVTHPYPC